MDAPYHPPVKRSVEIAGHKSSISLEPIFWELLKRAAAEQRLPINALVARIDARRLDAPSPPGLASAVRVWLASRFAGEQVEPRPVEPQPSEPEPVGSQ